MFLINLRINFFFKLIKCFYLNIYDIGEFFEFMFGRKLLINFSKFIYWLLKLYSFLFDFWEFWGIILVLVGLKVLVFIT